VHSILGVDTGAIDPRWKVDSMGPSGIGRVGESGREKRVRTGAIFVYGYFVVLYISV
jgi:hypothetical protein